MARRGSRTYREKLDSVPDCPEEMEYLVNVARQLTGRSGYSSVGPLLLSPTVLADWLTLMDETLTPMECEAVFALDAAMLHPGEPEAEAKAVTPKVPAAERWPKAKGA